MIILRRYTLTQRKSGGQWYRRASQSPLSMIDRKELHFTLRVQVPLDAPDHEVYHKLAQFLSELGLPMHFAPALFNSEDDGNEKH